MVTVCVCVLFILYSLYLGYDKIHFSPILRGVTLTCPPSPPLGQMYHPFLLPPITSHINWPLFLEYNLHIPSSDDNHSKNPRSHLVQGLFDVIAVEYPNPQSRVRKDTGKNDLTRRVTHREAVFGPVIHSIFDAWHYDVLWTCKLTRLL